MTSLFRAMFSRQMAPPRTGRCALLAAMVLVLAACSFYPLGMSEDEWMRLTPEQQMAARMKQADLNRANAERRAEQAAARRQKYAALEAAERRRTEKLYRSSRYGDVLECVVEGGVADFRPGWRPYTPVPFTLARGEIKSVTLSAGNRRGKFWAQYSPDGLSMKLCYRNPRGRSGRFCASVNGHSQDFSAGITRRLSVNRVFKNANVVCAYRPERNMPEIYIQRHDRYVYRVIHNHHYRSRARRTPVVIHNHYTRPAPRQRTKTVIHERYHQAPPRQRARRREHVAPRREYRRGQRQIRPTYQPPQEVEPAQVTRPLRRTPARVEPPEVDDIQHASPVTNVPDRTRAHRVAKPRRSVKKRNARSIRRHKRGRKKHAKGKRIKDQSEDESLTSAPAPRGKWRRGKPERD